MTESRGSLPAAEGPGDVRGDRHRARRGERLVARGQAAPRLVGSAGAPAGRGPEPAAASFTASRLRGRRRCMRRRRAGSFTHVEGDGSENC